MSKAIVHLDGALRVADVEDLIDASGFFDSRNVRRIIIEAHVGPGVHPVLVILGGVILGVPLAVLCATIVGQPDIIASVSQLQMEWMTSVPAR